jgi:hypothetical protein
VISSIVTLRFQILYCLVLVDLARRKIVHIGVTSSPSAQYAGQCFVDAIADRDDENPRFMIRDRDSISCALLINETICGVGQTHPLATSGSRHSCLGHCCASVHRILGRNRPPRTPVGQSWHDGSAPSQHARHRSIVSADSEDVHDASGLGTYGTEEV